MPTYEYNCSHCGNFELVQKITDNPLKTCPDCDAPVRRLVSAVPFHLKGMGWYKTDYANSCSANGASTKTKAVANSAANTTLSPEKSCGCESKSSASV